MAQQQQTQETQRLPAATSVGEVRLKVASLVDALGFYQYVLGYNVTELEDGQVALSADGGLPDFILTEQPGAHPKPRRTSGLFHAAILLPARRDLARIVQRLVSQKWDIGGASDHGVSEALYLNDADGNGLEIYVDRPRDSWPMQGSQVEMFTRELDFESLFAELNESNPEWDGMPAGTRIGHLHLQVSDMEASRRFYVDTLGFDVSQDSYPGALFVSAGGYHHHVGMNTWAGKGVPRQPESSAGMTGFTIIIPNPAALDSLGERLGAAGVQIERADDGAAIVLDPDGTQVRLRTA